MKETAYEHVEGEKTFTVTACERWSIGMINRLKEAHPDEVEIRHVNEDGSLVAWLPTEWLRIVPKRTSNMTEEQKAKTAARLAAGRSANHSSTGRKAG